MKTHNNAVERDCKTCGFPSPHRRHSVQINQLIESAIMIKGFSPISLEDYLDRHMESNPDEDRSEVETRIKDMIKFHNDGGRCTCGNEIWIVGSAAARWAACFSHITGEAYPDDDFEIIF